MAAVYICINGRIPRRMRVRVRRRRGVGPRSIPLTHAWEHGSGAAEHSSSAVSALSYFDEIVVMILALRR